MHLGHAAFGELNVPVGSPAPPAARDEPRLSFPAYFPNFLVWLAAGEGVRRGVLCPVPGADQGAVPADERR